MSCEKMSEDVTYKWCFEQLIMSHDIFIARDELDGN